MLHGSLDFIYISAICLKLVYKFEFEINIFFKLSSVYVELKYSASVCINLNLLIELKTN